MSSAIEVLPLGSQGLHVTRIGLGAMGMTAFYNDNPAATEPESLATLAKAVELSAPHPAFIDTAWVYAHPSGAHNEELIGKAIKTHGRDKFIIATKFGIKPDFTMDSSEASIRSSLADSLRRLGTTYVDLYYQHRVDPKTPMETVAETFKKLHAEGKIKYAGLSECTADELRRAHRVFPITAVQMEYSLQTRDVEAKLIPTCRELGVGIVAYSPLGRGFLSATFTKKSDLPEKDWRRSQPRFSDEAFAANAAKAAALQEIAKRLDCTPAQLALAWLLHRGKDIFPIPGTKSRARLVENLGAIAVSHKLTEAIVKEIEAAVPEAVGDRYSSMSATFNNRL